MGKTYLVDQPTLTAHTSNTTMHTTAAEKTSWNNKPNFLGMWNCGTGLATTLETGYTYKAGDWFKIGTIATSYSHALHITGTNCIYRADSSSIDASGALVNNSTDLLNSKALLIAYLTANGNTSYATRISNVLTSGSFTSVYQGTTTTLAYNSNYPGDLYTEESSLEIARAGYAISLTGTIEIADTVTNVATQYAPTGSSYTGTASTVVESGPVAVGDIYYYDGTNWVLDLTHSIVTTAEKTAWNAKYDKPAAGIPDSDIVSASTWNAKYDKPAAGIPDSDIVSASTWNAKYDKPAAGIPDSDIASASTWNAKQERFVATYNTTTYADLLAAYNAGKDCYVQYTDSTYSQEVLVPLTNWDSTGTQKFFFTTMGGTTAGMTNLWIKCALNGSSTVWTAEQKEVQEAGKGIPYETTAPTAANSDGLKVVVLTSEPATKYSGWLYFITEA